MKNTYLVGTIPDNKRMMFMDFLGYSGRSINNSELGKDRFFMLLFGSKKNDLLSVLHIIDNLKICFLSYEFPDEATEEESLRIWEEINQEFESQQQNSSMQQDLSDEERNQLLQWYYNPDVGFPTAFATYPIAVALIAQ